MSHTWSRVAGYQPPRRHAAGDRPRARARAAKHREALTPRRPQPARTRPSPRRDPHGAGPCHVSPARARHADFLALSPASQRRNAPSWFTLIDRCFDFRGMRPELLLAARWPELATPTTFVWGERDAWGAPELGDAIAARNPRIKVVRIPDAGHAPWFDAPGPVLAAIEAALA